MAEPAFDDPSDSRFGAATRGDGERKYGRYVLGEEIGTGSMGRVFRAIDPLANRVVAIKTLRSEAQGRSTEGAYRQRLLREAEAAGRLSHPSVVRIFDQGDGFLVMELLAGSLLPNVLLEHGAFTLAEAVPILTTVADALDHAHSRGVIHRDVRPANIMIPDGGSPKLLDFGLSRFAGEKVAPGDRFTGSVWYMAPEQITDGAVTPQSDLFSLAAVAYEMLTGQRPFDGDNLGTVTYRIVYEQFAPPTTRAGGLPAMVDEVFARALAKDPERRLPNMSAFVRALEAHLPRPAPRPARAPDSLVPAAPSIRETQDLRSILKAGLGVGSFRGTAEPERCALEVDSDPAGAGVTIDGVSMGTTPLLRTDLPGGTRSVRVEKAGFAPVELTLALSPGASAPRLGFTLQRVAAPPVRGEAPPKEKTRRKLRGESGVGGVGHRPS